MDLSDWKERSPGVWELPRAGAMRVPGVIYASKALMRAMDEKVREQLRNVAVLPGIVGASFAMPDAHWGYGFPIGGVPPFGHPAPVPTFVDPDLLTHDEVWAAGGTPQVVFGVEPRALVSATGGTVVQLAAP